jgi:hypothetical protein
MAAEYVRNTLICYIILQAKKKKVAGGWIETLEGNDSKVPGGTLTARSSQPPDQSRRASASARERPRRRRGQSQTGAGGCDLAADGGEALLRPNMGNAEGGRWKGGKRPRPAVRRPVRVDAGGGASPVPHRPPGGRRKKKNG